MNYQAIFNWKNLIINLFFLLLVPLVLSVIAFNYLLVIPADEVVAAYQGTDNLIFSEGTRKELTPIVKFGVNFKANYQDSRAFVLDKYFAMHGSPLVGLGDQFVAACDKYGAPHDCTTIPAIAYTETGLCTLGISQAQFNCWGWGGSGENRILFSSYPEAIDTITRKMVKGYGKNMSYPDRIASTYCGAHCFSWASSVQEQRHKINNVAKQLNLPNLF